MNTFWHSEHSFVGYNDVEDGFEQPYSIATRCREKIEDPSAVFQRVSQLLQGALGTRGDRSTSRDHPPLERPEGSPVDASEKEQEIPSACLGETPYPISAASSDTLTRPELILSNGVLE